MHPPTLRQILTAADGQHRAVAHFNVSELSTFNAVTTVARELQLPVIVGVSEGERQFFDIRQIAALVRVFRDSNSSPIFLNADHTHTLEGARAAAKAGFDMIVVDASKEDFAKNIADTRTAVEELKSINPDIIVEGELGYLGASSTIHSGSDSQVMVLTDPLEAKAFVDATRVDALSPAVGTMHGMLESMVQGNTKKHLDIARIAAIKGITKVFLTLHGGSGTDDDDFVAAAQAGITVIHINTELRVAWRKGLDEGLRQAPHEIVPHKVLGPARARVEEVVRSRMKLFAGAAVAAGAVRQS